MRLRWIRIMYLKEMLDLLRDRRTIISMIVVPTLAMPLVAFGMQYFIRKSTKEIKEKTFTMAFREDKKLPGLLESFQKEGFKINTSPSPKEAVESKEAEVGIEVIPSPPAVEKNTKETPEIKTMEDLQKYQAPAPILVKVYADLAHYEGLTVQRKVNQSLAILKSTKISLSLAGRGIDLIKLNPFNIENVNLAPPQKMAGMILGQILGYFIIIMMMSGGAYAAIDMTAGEKERKTLEMLLSAPCSRQEIVMGKVLATITITFVTAILTLISFGATFYLNKGDPEFAKLLGNMKGLPIDFLTMTILTLTILPLSVLCASLLVLVSTFAKGFKEAQSYLTPLIMVAIFPAMVGFIPGIKMQGSLTIIPLINFSLFIKELLLGEWGWLNFFLTFGSNMVYASVAFFFCVKIFQNEKILLRM